MKAAVFHGVEDIRIETVEDPRADAGSVVLEVIACGVCGSDIKTFLTGKLARTGQILGHEFVGRIVEIGSGVTGVKIGEVVTAMPFSPCKQCPRCLEGKISLCENAFDQSIANGLPGGLAQYVRIPGAEVGTTLFRLPQGVSPEFGALSEPLAVGLHAVEISGAKNTDIAVVLGLGTIGLAVVCALVSQGVGMIVAVDPSSKRRDVASRMGAMVVDPANQYLVEVVQSFAGKGKYGYLSNADLLFDCAGSVELLNSSLKLLRLGGSVVLAALYREKLVIDGTMMVRRGVKMVGTFAYDDQFGRAVQMLQAGPLSVENLVSHRFGLDQVMEAFRTQADPQSSVKVFVKPEVMQ